MKHVLQIWHVLDFKLRRSCELRAIRMASLNSLNPFQRHKRLIKELESFYGEPPTQQNAAAVVLRTDEDVLRDTYRFVRTDADEGHEASWELKVARAYYAKLFREYAIVDLSRYKTGALGCRWRTKREVLDGKGQFICGSQNCSEQQGLDTYEVPFAYTEAGTSKQALVKVRLCQKHGLRLNYKRNKQSLRRNQSHKRKQSSEKPEQSSSEGEAKRRSTNTLGKGDELPVNEKPDTKTDRGLSISHLQSPAGPARDSSERLDGPVMITEGMRAASDAEVERFLSDLLL